MPSGYQLISTQPAMVYHDVRIAGAGAANPTDVMSAGVTITWVSTGRYRFVWGSNPGTWRGMLAGFESTTPADTDGWTAVAGAYNSTTFTVDVYVYSDTPALADLAASTNLLNLIFRFTTTGVSG